MISKQYLHKTALIASWTITIAAVAYIGMAMWGSREVRAEETNTLVCNPASANNSYTLPPATAWRLTENTTIGDTAWSGHWLQQSMVTDGNDQYVAYYNADRRMTIAHRTLGSTSWQRYSIPGSDAVVGWDSHNYVTAAVDKAGNLHVSGNLHGHSMRYWKTTTPRDLDSIQRVTNLVNAANEDRVTYPQFLKDKNDDLIFNYRNGESGSGQVYFNKYDASNNTWQALLQTNLFDGQASTPDRSAYFTLSSSPNDAGYYEMTWVWRDTGDVATNSRLSYARSSDLQNWETASGSQVSLPITYETPGVIVDDIPEGGGIFNNQERVGVDADGRPTITYSKYDQTGSNQIYVARPNGVGAWQSAKITNWTGAWNFYGYGTVSNRISVAATVVTPNGDLRLGFTCNGATPGSGTIILDNNSLTPIAQIGAYATDTYPSAVLQTTATTPPSAARRVTNTVQGANGPTRYIMKWQSQGVNQDAPFAQWPDAQPVYVYTLIPYSAADAPSNLTVNYQQNNTAVNLAWNAPADTGGYPITDYLIEYSGDRGDSWTIFAHPASASTSALITGLNPDTQYSFRVSPVTMYGTGNSITAMSVILPEDEEENTTPQPIPDGSTAIPTAPGGQQTGPGAPNTGLLSPRSVSPLAILALSVSVSAIILLSAYRRSERE